MRVTRDSLLRIARETAQERAYNDADIVAVYLTGSLRTADPMLGGTADIDLVFVHKNEPLKRREFIKLTPDFHLDIARRAKDEFRSPRELRGDPWLGHEIYDPILLYEREKFFDFVQASLRAGFEFEQPPLTLQRCRTLLAHGRGSWMDIAEFEGEAGPREIRKYMKALFHAVNAAAGLTGPPLWERRILLEFPARAQAIQKPGMVAAVYGLLGANHIDADRIKAWLPDWKQAFKAAADTPGVEARIHKARANYYEKAAKFMLDGESPLAALWLVLHTWTLSCEMLGGNHLGFWRNACGELNLLGKSFHERMQGLDQFLDEIELMLDETAAANGLDVQPLTGI
jgi:hypothetical protein